MTENALAPAAVDGDRPPVAAQAAALAGAAQVGDRPEVPVAAAFAGGFLLAMLLKRATR